MDDDFDANYHIRMTNLLKENLQAAKDTKRALLELKEYVFELTVRIRTLEKWVEAQENTP